MNTMTWLQNGAAWAWHTSLVVAVPALILLALGSWRGFSARWRMLFAAALLARLMLPAVPELPWHPAAPLEHALAESPIPAIPAAAPVSTTEQTSEDESFVALSSVEEAAPMVTMPESRGMSWQAIIAVIWAAGVLAVCGWIVASHWLIRRWIARHATAPDAHVARLFQGCCDLMGLQRRVGLTAMPRIATAAVCGWLRPIVLVPANLRDTHSDDEIRGILLHELAHVRRCDVLWSWLGLAACALHWFNPLAWLALRRFHADRELDCDRMALDRMTAPQRHSYAPALFKTLQGPPLATSAALVPFFRHNHEIHNRILTIMKPSKSLVAHLAALTIIPALSILTLTTAGADDEKKPTEETPVKQRDGEGIKKGPRDGEIKKEGPRDGEVKKEGLRDGERKKVIREGEGEAVKKEKAPGDGEVKKEGLRDGERKKVIREGEGEAVKKEKAPGDGGVKKEGSPDGAAKPGSVDKQVEQINAKIAALEAQRLALQQGRKVARDGDGDGQKKVKVPAEVEVKRVKVAPADGEKKVKVPGDGAVKKEGLRDGEVKKEGPRDGEVKKEGPRDGDVKKEGVPDGEKPKLEGDR